MQENDILDHLIFDPDAGSLLFKDVRYMLIRPETLCAAQKGLEERFGAESMEILYESGFTGGKLSSHRYKALFHLSERGIVEFMCRMELRSAGAGSPWSRSTLKKRNGHHRSQFSLCGRLRHLLSPRMPPDSRHRRRDRRRGLRGRRLGRRNPLSGQERSILPI